MPKFTARIAIFEGDCVEISQEEVANIEEVSYEARDVEHATNIAAPMIAKQLVERAVEAANYD